MLYSSPSDSIYKLFIPCFSQHTDFALVSRQNLYAVGVENRYLLIYASLLGNLIFSQRLRRVPESCGGNLLPRRVKLRRITEQENGRGKGRNGSLSLGVRRLLLMADGTRGPFLAGSGLCIPKRVNDTKR